MRTSPDERFGISRTELLWVAAAVILGSAFRFAFPERMAIEHFDEGVYACNLWFGPEDSYEYPARHLYGPPLLPMVIEWTMIVAVTFGFSPTGFVPILPCLFAGIATIPSVWWITRRLFGASSGVLAAWLFAVSQFHCSYSRAGLTDVPVCFLILWAVHFGVRGLRSGHNRDIALASVFTALGWSTKYSGWLPLAILGSGAVAWQLTCRSDLRQPIRVGSRWFVMALAAGLLWSPVLVGLQKNGGYTAVAANHHQYVVGFNGWGNAALRQLTTVGLYDDWFGVLNEWIAAAPLHSKIQTELRQVSAIDVILHSNSYLGYTLVLASPLVLLMVSIVGCLLWTARNWRSETSLQGWILAAWICGLSLMTPTYHPYPRLALPWIVPIWIGVGLAIQELCNWKSPKESLEIERHHWRPNRLLVAIISFLVVVSFIRCGLGTGFAWQDRSGLARTMTQIAAQMKAYTKGVGRPAEETIVYVIGDPAVVFVLKANGLPLVAPVQDLSFASQSPSRPTFLIFSDRANRLERFRTQWNQSSTCFQSFAESTVRPSHLVVLDEYEPLFEIDRRLTNGDRYRVERLR